MIYLLIYFCKVSIGLAIFYGLYWIFFKHLTFFQFNRFYLILSLTGAFIIPFINLHWWWLPDKPILFYALEEPFYSLPIKLEFTRENPGLPAPLNYLLLIKLCYLGGICKCIYQNINNFRSILKLSKRGLVRSIKNIKLILLEENHCFSYFRTIFISKNQYHPLIVNHELVHIRQFHWIDLVIIELASIVLWFNPVIILYRRAIKLQHEYFVDGHLLKNQATKEEYLACLLQHITGLNKSKFVISFNNQSIKNRITMITTKKTPFQYSFLYLLVVPVIGLMLSAFSKPLSIDLTGTLPDPIITIQDTNQPAISPVDMSKTRFSSGFGMRMNPMTKSQQFHSGIDLVLARGERVVATAEGTVLKTSFNKKRGNYVLIRHSDQYTTSYSHLEEFIVKPGETVKQGQIIGYVGSTGTSTAPHLHYEVIKNGEKIDPIRFIPKSAR